MTRRPVRAAAVAAVIALPAVAIVSATTAAAQTIAITGGTVYPVSGAPIENGTVLIRDGKIAAVGAQIAIPADAQRVDATGKVVTPGLFDAYTALGVIEIVQEPSARDVIARGKDEIAAAFRVWDGLNSSSALLAPARNEGVTTALVAPRGGLVAGQAAVIDLVGRTGEEMVRRGPAAMVAQVNDPEAAGASARGEVVSRLRALLDDVKFYLAHRAAYERNASRELQTSRADLEALAPVVRGELPLLVTANRVDDIVAALTLARDYTLKVVILGGAEAWMVADKLAAANVAVVTGAMNNIPVSMESLNQRQENAALLRKAGVRVAIVGNAGDSDEDYYNVRNVKYEAGNAVSYGMSREDALRSVTLTPAELFGVSDRLGSLTVGRDADVVVWSGDPFEFSTRAEHVYIRGRDVRGEKSRQDLLTDRYRRK